MVEEKSVISFAVFSFPSLKYFFIYALGIKSPTGRADSNTLFYLNFSSSGKGYGMLPIMEPSQLFYMKRTAALS